MRLTRGGAPGRSPVSGWPWPRLHHSGSDGENPRFWASSVTYMTPVRGTGRNALCSCDIRRGEHTRMNARTIGQPVPECHGATRRRSIGSVANLAKVTGAIRLQLDRSRIFLLAPLLPLPPPPLLLPLTS